MTKASYMKNSCIIFLVWFNLFSVGGQNNTQINELCATKAPEWITNGVIYQMQLRAFTPEGTLKAATARLNELAKLGITVIYICPVCVADDDPDQRFWSPRQKASGMNNPRNPYRIKDYYHVDTEYGSDDDLKEFITGAHHLGMRVMLDMVYLHCGPNAVFLKEYPNFIKRNQNGDPLNADWSFPGLNFDDPELREYLWKNMEYWVTEFYVDGFRCDAVDHTPLDFWETANERLGKIRVDIALLAEGGRRENQLKAFNIGYGYPWQTFNAVLTRQKPASTIRESWESFLSERPKGTHLMLFTDNHDIANDDRENRVEKRWTTAGLNMALVATFTFDGTPMLYNGQEVADANRHSIFGRLPINWNNVNTAAGKERFSLCQKLCKIRSAETALTHGTVEWIDNDTPDKVLSYIRSYKGDKILTVINLTNVPVKTTLKKIIKSEIKQYKPLLEHAVKTLNSPEFEIQGHGYWVGKISASRSVQ